MNSSMATQDHDIYSSPPNQRPQSYLDGARGYNEGPIGDASQTTETYVDDGSEGAGPQRHSTLKKKGSIVRRQSLRRSGSRRRSTADIESREHANSVFYSPVPSQSNPTEILAERFSGWRRILKDFIAYFREVSSSYENKAKFTGKLFQTLNNAVQPEMFLRTGGILETNVVLKEYHKSAIIAHEKARQIDTEIIAQLTGLRNDLSVKIKEIKGLSSDFKNSLEKEREITRKVVSQLGEALSAGEGNPSLAAGKNDPYVVKLSVDRQVRRQLTEENYLHRAFLNLEGSGRELENIAVGEIQKAFKLYVDILKREGSDIVDTAERLETQTLGLPGDYEWNSFVEKDPNFIGPKFKIRAFDDIQYPGFDHPSVTEVGAGMLGRKSKYLKSYTPGWYALSPSHLHEFKTADRTRDLTPVMSLYLPDSAMGSHTGPGSSSHKFMVKGRQTGHMHRWVFRAESHEAMMGFYEDIKKLTDLSGAERNAFVASHARQASVASYHESQYSGSENGLDNDEADEVPYSAEKSALVGSHPSIHEARPEGGRFPSDLDVNRIRSPRSATSGESDRSGTEHPSGVTWDDNHNTHNPSGGSFDPVSHHEHLDVPATQRPRHHHRTSSAFSYDERHPVTSTHVEGEEFVPVGADIPPAVERSLSKRTAPVETLESPLEQRDSSTSWTRKTPSRKPTAVYGFDPTEEQPQNDLSSITNANFQSCRSQPVYKQPAQSSQETITVINNTDYAKLGVPEESGESDATYKHQAQSNIVHSPSAVIPPIPEPIPTSTIHADEADVNPTPSQASAGLTHPTSTGFSGFIRNTLSGQIPTSGTTTSGRFNPEAEVPRSNKDYGELGFGSPGPEAYRTNSNLTISDLDVPGKFPKGT